MKNQHHLFRLHEVNLQLNQTIITLTYAQKVKWFLYQIYVSGLGLGLVGISPLKISERLQLGSNFALVG